MADNGFISVAETGTGQTPLFQHDALLPRGVTIRAIKVLAGHQFLKDIAARDIIRLLEIGRLIHPPTPTLSGDHTDPTVVGAHSEQVLMGSTTVKYGETQ